MSATVTEVRLWAQGLGLPISNAGSLPQAVIDRWNREHPERPLDIRSGRPGWRPFRHLTSDDTKRVAALRWGNR